MLLILRIRAWSRGPTSLSRRLNEGVEYIFRVPGEEALDVVAPAPSASSRRLPVTMRTPALSQKKDTVTMVRTRRSHFRRRDHRRILSHRWNARHVFNSKQLELILNTTHS